MSSSICEICEKEASKYCCPRCNVLYCSLNCYKDCKHAECSEEFYRKSVFEELKLQSGNDGSKKEMIEMLTRLENEEEEDIEELDSDDEISEDLSARLKNIDLENADAVWAQLTNDERQQFQSLVSSGDIVKLMPKVEPWYCVTSKTTEIPGVIDVSDFSKFSTRPPALEVKFNLLNILAAYSYMTRYFLCDYKDFEVEACNCLCILSGSLKKNCDFTSRAVALKSIFIEGLSYSFEVDTDMEPTIISDVEKLIKTGDGCYISAALSDMLQMMKKMKKPAQNKNVENGQFSRTFQDKINQIPDCFTKGTWSVAIKRLEYFLAYTKSFYLTEILLIL